MWSSSLPVSLFSCISLFIAVLSHFLGLLGTACRRSARFARFARSRASLGRHLRPSWARLGLPKPSQDSSKIPKIAIWKRLGRVLDRLGAVLERLGTISGRLGACLVRLGAILASQKPPKIAPRRLRRYEKIAVARVWRFRGVTGSTFSIIFQKRRSLKNQ